MRDFVICIDIDCTLNNLVHEWIDQLNKIYGLSVTYDNIVEWSICEAYPSLKEEDVYAPIYDTDMLSKLKPLPDSQKYVKQLIEDGNKVYISTATSHDVINEKIKWLDKYFPFINKDNVIVIKNKQMLLCDVMIDDYVDNLVYGCYKGILIDCPWNHNFNISEYGIRRAYDWKEVYENICDIKTSVEERRKYE